jgi:hypothetical protein
MLRFAANVVFILCLVVWCSFVLVICMSVIEHGIGGITPELIHLFGRTNQLGVLSSSIMIWRMFWITASHTLNGLRPALSASKPVSSENCQGDQISSHPVTPRLSANFATPTPMSDAVSRILLPRSR